MGEETIIMARRAVISASGLKGYLLEEVVASLICAFQAIVITNSRLS
jgi:hypothetical protein